MLFKLGQLMITPGAIEELRRNNINPADLIRRHVNGDWGDICKEDKELNCEAVVEGTRILSSYKLDNEKVWIITEADRSSTTVLLSSEY